MTVGSFFYLIRFISNNNPTTYEFSSLIAKVKPQRLLKLV